MEIVIRGHNLPGRTFAGGDEPAANVHVGLQVRRDPADLVPGDASTAQWHLDVRVEVDDEGALDFKGPAVHGRRGERFVYLTWGDVGSDGTFRMFRRAKLMLGHVEPVLIRDATTGGRPLLATVDLTDGCGGPRCGRLGPPALSWTAG